MKLSVNLKDLVSLVGRMGGGATSWRITDVEISPRAKRYQELEKGKEIQIDQLEPGPGKLLTFEGEQVILYIKDTRSPKEVLQHHPEDSRRFHIADCKTLSDMKAKGRYQRYVATTRNDGLFLVDFLEHETDERGEIEAGLKVCKLCLQEVNYQSYKNKKGNKSKSDQIWSQFSISSFLKEYSTFFTKLPDRRDRDAPIDVYVTRWAEISKKTREDRNWICEKCEVNLISHPSLLHTHHINGVKTDNTAKNLKVLCSMCHSEEPSHNHLRVTISEKSKIRHLRSEQNQ